MRGKRHLLRQVVNTAIVLLLFCSMSCGNGGGCGSAPENPLFLPDPDYNVMASSISVSKWGDLDNDGILDFVCITDADCRFYSGIGDGSFNEELTIPGTDFTDIELQDFDADGYIDVAITISANPNYSISIYTNDGSWGFTETDSVILAGHIDVVKGADYDNDGRIDLAVSGASYFEVLHNTTSGFQIASTGITGERFFNWVDYDCDGNIDMAVCRNDSVQLYQNNGDSSFTATTSISLTYTADAIIGTAWSDMNADGKPDITVYGFVSSTNTGYLQVFVQGVTVADWSLFGERDFLLTSTSVVNFTPYTISEGDCLSDPMSLLSGGYPSIVAVAESGIRDYGNVDGNYISLGGYLYYTNCQLVTLIDYNNDGDMDIYTGGILLEKLRGGGKCGPICSNRVK